jgi:glycosyltransferase involved in cell wall biosynthesis
MTKNFVTIVTVVFNGEANLEKTIKSIINQSYKNFEYIIVDGNSTDASIDIIRKYNYAIDHWISENDISIYDAMNKGINLASGKWINFMNCGDEFSSLHVLSDIFNSNKISGVHVIYGNHEVIYPDKKKKYVKSGEIEDFWKGSKFCHQASFTNLKSLKSRLFSTQFRLASDFDFFYNFWLSGAKFKYIDLNIASISSGGVSDKCRLHVLFEWWRIVEKRPRTFFFYFVEAFIQILKAIVKLITRNL